MLALAHAAADLAGEGGRLLLRVTRQRAGRACLAVRVEAPSLGAAAAVEIRERTGKPTALVLPEVCSDAALWEVERGRAEARLHYVKNGVPCFETSRALFSTLRRVAEYYRNR